MRRTENAYVSGRESIIATEMESVARDLALLDPADLIGYIRGGQFANLGSLVGSSIELFFAAGTLRFGNGATVDVGWHTPPVVTFDMEFHHNKVHAYFRLAICAEHPRVQLDFIRFDDQCSSPIQNTAHLRHSMMEARIAG